MVGITEASALITSFNGVKELAKALMTLRDAEAFQGKVIEFQEAIMDVQQRVFAVQEERQAAVSKVAELEKKIASLEQWENERRRYELRDFGGGTFAYALKSGMESGEPFHRLCPTCYEQGRRSILQSDGRQYDRREKVHCGFCQCKLLLGASNPPSMGSAPRNDWSPFDDY